MVKYWNFFTCKGFLKAWTRKNNGKYSFLCVYSFIVDFLDCSDDLRVLPFIQL